jgi:hypothetical protein
MKADVSRSIDLRGGTTPPLFFSSRTVGRKVPMIDFVTCRDARVAVRAIVCVFFGLHGGKRSGQQPGKAPPFKSCARDIARRSPARGDPSGVILMQAGLASTGLAWAWCWPIAVGKPSIGLSVPDVRASGRDPAIVPWRIRPDSSWEASNG